MKYTFQQKQGESSNPEKKNKNYKKYSQDELRESVIGWVMQKKKTRRSRKFQTDRYSNNKQRRRNCIETDQIYGSDK